MSSYNTYIPSGTLGYKFVCKRNGLNVKPIFLLKFICVSYNSFADTDGLPPKEL